MFIKYLEIITIYNMSILILILLCSSLLQTLSTDPTPSLTQAPLPSTQPLILKMQPFAEQYVVAFMFNDHEQLLGIHNSKDRNSWIFIDEGTQEHKVCFDGVIEMQTANQYEVGDDGIEIPVPYCIGISQLKCRGLCRKIGEVDSKDKYAGIKGKFKYEVEILSLGQKIKYPFLSAEIVNVTSSIPILDPNQISLSTELTRQFYSTIVGSINIAQIPICTVNHTSQPSQHIYIKSLQSLPQISIVIPPKANKIGLSIQNTTLIQRQLTFSAWFNSTMMSLGLPVDMYTLLKDHIINKIFDGKCQKTDVNEPVLLCKINLKNKIKNIKIKICWTECLEVVLDDLLLIWGKDDDSMLDDSEFFSYFFKVYAQYELSTIKLYPQFANLYQMVITKGTISNLIKHANPGEPNSTSDKDHGHHQHVQKPEQSSSLASTPASTPASQAEDSKNNSLNTLFDIFCIVSASVMMILCCKWLKNKAVPDVGVVQNWQDGVLMDEQVTRNRKKIFEGHMSQIQGSQEIMKFSQQQRTGNTKIGQFDGFDGDLTDRKMEQIV